MNVAYCMDCMEYMKTLPDNAFDLAVVDPPYGINIASHANGQVVGGGQGHSEATKTVYGRSRKAMARLNPIIPSQMTAHLTKGISKSWRE